MNGLSSVIDNRITYVGRFFLALFFFLSSVTPIYAVSLSDLTEEERLSLQLACQNTISNNSCRQIQLQDLEKVHRITKFGNMNEYDQIVLRASCKSVMPEGPARYNLCLIKELMEWDEGPSVDLNALLSDVQKNLFSNCEHYSDQGLASFHKCLVDALKKIIASTPKEPQGKNLSQGGIKPKKGGEGTPSGGTLLFSCTLCLSTSCLE